MTQCNSDDILEWLKPTLKKQDLKTYAVNVSGNTEKGDGYLGDITFVDVSGKTENDEEKRYSFVLKTGKKSKEFREMIPVRQAFKNEMVYYTEVLPTFIDFQKQKGIKDGFLNAPKCYDKLITEDMELIVLENLKTRGFTLHDRKQPMDKEHVRKVVTSYGKLHAISFAMKDQKPEVFKKLSGNLVDVLKMMPKASPEEINLYEHVIKAAEETNDLEIVEKANILNKKAFDLNDVTDPDDPYAVIVHGDCWNNNFMFKYENNQISDICLLDYQLSRLASPVYDLSYFLFTCLSEDDIQNFDEINSLYYETLSNFLRELGSDPDKMFPFEELLNQWKKFSLFGLVLMPSIIRICLSEKDEVPDLVEAAETSGSFVDVFSQSIKSVEMYKKRTLPIMRLAISKGFV